ncbi:LysR family transcriptional regulator [Bordetella genomosp. 4]|uniref:LysR family transcriptional regulator n=1 Tax=Bordetella genomosp. 4 TaxID=463044 RepID=A0A261TTI2_9BORD|nr:LysR family transcriptional regulator [Bordetella genomosp. 4]OZI44304.1 LysR family transcriptional regulator [Bordetella genomosp. 4]OZI52939.1 LysR family transcriptional regulator [Bordetella genomosp. 4]
MLRELQTFMAVVRYGTFANAAAHIGLTQSAVSAQIQRLEEELGYPLFDRTGRSANLNSNGREALAVAEELMSVYSKFGRNTDVPKTGLIRIGSIASAQETFLAEALAEFWKINPGYRIRMVPGISLNLLGQVDSGEIDIAVMLKPPFALPADLQWRELYAEPFVLLAPQKMQDRSWQDLLQTEPFIRYDRGSFGGRLVDQFLRHARFTVRETIELDELQAIAQLVRLGVGVALLPMSDALRIPKGVTAIDLGDATFFREIGLVERPSDRRQPVATLLAQRIAEAAVRFQGSSKKIRTLPKTASGIDGP